MDLRHDVLALTVGFPSRLQAKGVARFTGMREDFGSDFGLLMLLPVLYETNCFRALSVITSTRKECVSKTKEKK